MPKSDDSKWLKRGWNAPSWPFETRNAASTLPLVAVSNNASVGGRRGMAWKVGAVLREDVSGTPTRGRCQSTMPTSDSYKAKTVEHKLARMRPKKWRQRMALGGLRRRT